ncbi:MAG: DUF2062 domain-containing protein [Deltaproteobacteria bacterium]|nr:MAG: DUF2062 domain-containing protein [Deltaproteobacteria bacterium]
MTSVEPTRTARYYYLRLRRLRGQPEELAMGMALGVFAGSLPIIPFQTALAVALALCFKASKLTAAIGTWVSNPFDWYFFYFYSYKFGAVLLGLPEHKALFSRILNSVQQGHSFLKVAETILETGSVFALAFLVGGILIGIALAPISYILSVLLFRKIKKSKASKKGGLIIERP